MLAITLVNQILFFKYLYISNRYSPILLIPYINLYQMDSHNSQNSPNTNPQISNIYSQFNPSSPHPNNQFSPFGQNFQTYSSTSPHYRNF